MVYVFGMNIPLMEFNFIILIVGLILAIILVYIMFKVMQISKKTDSLIKQEKKKLVQFSDMTDQEKKELEELRNMRKELDEILDEEEDELKALKKLRVCRGKAPAKRKHTKKPASKTPTAKKATNAVEKGSDFVKALLGATMRHEAKPIWRTEKWHKEGLVLVLREDNGKIKEWKKHPLAGIPEHQLPWKKEHWRSDGDVLTLRREDGTLIDWTKL